jgi:hypothetical protein
MFWTTSKACSVRTNREKSISLPASGKVSAQKIGDVLASTVIKAAGGRVGQDMGAPMHVGLFRGGAVRASTPVGVWVQTTVNGPRVLLRVYA